MPLGGPSPTSHVGDHRAMLDSAVLQEFIERRGGRLYHVTPVEHVPSILADGLVPGSERGVSTRRDFFSTRPGRVYLLQLQDVAVVEIEGEPRVLAVDLRHLDPDLMDPDEDIVQQHLSGMVTTLPPARELSDGIEIPGQEGGLARWADSTPEFDRPEVTARSLMEHGRISYRGRIPPEAIQLVDLPSEHLARFVGLASADLGIELATPPAAGGWRIETLRARVLGEAVIGGVADALALPDVAPDLRGYRQAQDCEERLRRLALEAVRAEPIRLDESRVLRATASIAEKAIEFEPISVRHNLDCALEVAEACVAALTELRKVCPHRPEAAADIADRALTAAASVSWQDARGATI
jgi:hypothetical protein